MPRKQLSPAMKKLVWDAPASNAGAGWNPLGHSIDGFTAEKRGRVIPDLPLDDYETEEKRIFVDAL